MRRAPSSPLPSCILSLNPSVFNPSRFILASLMACLLAMASPLWAQQTPTLVTQAVDNSVRTVLPGNVHPLARAEFDQGEAPPDLELHRMLLVLKRSDQQEAALRGLLEKQQYKKSPSYHQWLTPEQFGAQFGPADSDIAAVTNWLTASGFQIARVSNGRTVIEFSGRAGQVKQAFGTAIHKYAIKGEEHWANASNPSIPTALAPIVAGVNTLHNFFKKPQNIKVGTYSEKTKQLTSTAPGLTSTTLCAQGESTCYAVSPFDFAAIYDVLPLWTAATPINGTGQTIAIVGRTDIYQGDPTSNPPIPSDAVAFWTLFGLGQNGVPMPTLKVIYNGPNPGITDPNEEAEADIDTQWSGAVAPGATIDFVVSESTETDDGVDLSALYIVDNNVAPVMSESFGTCEAFMGGAELGFYGTLWEQAAAQGISAMVSAGDNGSAGCDHAEFDNAAQYGLNVSGLASTPFNVAVGGTDFNQYNNWSTYWNSTNATTTQQSAKGPIPETTWNDTCTNTAFLEALGYSSNAETNCNNSKQLSGLVNTVGGSGGESGYWLTPPWQMGLGVPSTNARYLPDVSLFASEGYLMHSFYVVCQSDQTPSGCDLNDLQGFGGTSVASPAFAGIMALVNQKVGSPVGNPNFVLYDLASNHPTAFHDIGVGFTNAMPCVTSTQANPDPNCTTNTSGDALGVLSGYSTTTNYDLATGLGSVDAAILVNNWNKVTFTPTATTLTLSVPANTTHGASVPVMISVSPSPATGDVALLVSPKPGTRGIDGFTLNGGTVNSSTTLLPGGTYQVIAHYEGDGTYGGSYSSATANITVNPENSSVYLPGVVVFLGYDNNGNPVFGISSSVVYGTGAGDLYWLRADVENSKPKFCNPPEFGGTSFIACPTGNITFTDNTIALDGGTFKLNNEGYTEDQGIQLTAGTHTLGATYHGDASYNPSPTATAVITVSKATSLIGNVQTTSSSVNTGQQFTVTASVTTSLTTNTSFGLAPTGTVSFYYNSTQLMGTVQLTPTPGNLSAGFPASLAASLTTSIPTAGTYSITATYNGDNNYTAVTQSNSAFITVAAPSFTLSTAPGTLTVAQGSNGTSTITVNPAGGFTGSVALAVTSTLPNGVTASFNPTSTTGTSILTLTASGSATTGGPTTVTITGTASGGLMATTTIALTVTPPPNFTLSAAPTTLSIAQGSNDTSTITVTPANGFASSVALAVTSTLPTGVTASFNPTSTTGTSILTLTASGSATVGGPTTVTITGTSGSLIHTTTVALTVTLPPNFTLAAVSPLSIPQGTSGTSTITVTPTNGFTGSVSLAVTSTLPSGVTAAFNPTSTSTASVLTLTLTNTATLGGPTTVTITGTSGSLTHTATIALTITPIPFTIAPIANVTIAAPGSPGTASLTVTPSNFTGTVNIACTLPAAMTEATCPSIMVSVAGTTPATGMLTITTTGPHQVAAIRPAAAGTLGFGVLAGVFIFAIPGLRRRKAPLILLLFGLVVLIASCGGGSGSSTHTDPGTPAGTYTVKLSATGDGATVPASFMVTVQ